MRTTLTLDDDIFEAARSQALASGKNLGKFLSMLARRGLRSANQNTNPSGLPVFKVLPNAEIIPSNRASELIAEEIG